MKTPYQILDVDCSATDLQIKSAYLKQVKDNPPDRNQETFQLIHNAYLLIKDKNCRTRYDLFTFPIADFDELTEQALSTEQELAITPQLFNKLLSGSIDDDTIQNAMSRAEKS